MPRQYPNFVPFEQREADFRRVQNEIKAQYPGFNLWITDVRHDCYGIYRDGSRKQVLRIRGHELKQFNTDGLDLAPDDDHT